MDTDASAQVAPVPASFAALLRHMPLQAVVAATGRPVSTVASWKERDNVPPEYWPDLIGLAQAHGVSVDEVTLTRWAVARRQRRQQAA